MIPTIDIEATGENIKRIRKMRGVSVREMQKTLGFTNPQAIYKWQKGKCLPSIDNLIILAWMLESTIDEILVRKE